MILREHSDLPLIMTDTKPARLYPQAPYVPYDSYETAANSGCFLMFNHTFLIITRVKI